jgi:hypothetical protein
MRRLMRPRSTKPETSTGYQQSINQGEAMEANNSGATPTGIMQLIDAQYFNGVIRLTWKCTDGRQVITEVSKSFTDGILAAAASSAPLVAATDNAKLTPAAIMELIDAQYLNGAIRLTWENNDGERVLTDACKIFIDCILKAAGQVAPLVETTDNEPIYQVAASDNLGNKAWFDADKNTYDSYAISSRRIVFATQVAPQATELDSVTISKMNTLRENGMRQVGVVMMDDSGKRATIDMGKVLWSTSKADIGEAIHYPECWDTAAYPTLRDAISAIGAFKCSNDDGQHDAAIRNVALEEAAEECDARAEQYEREARGGDNSGASDHKAYASNDLARDIRALKSATPSPIKAEPTGEQQ